MSQTNDIFSLRKIVNAGVDVTLNSEKIKPSKDGQTIIKDPYNSRFWTSKLRIASRCVSNPLCLHSAMDSKYKKILKGSSVNSRAISFDKNRVILKEGSASCINDSVFLNNIRRANSSSIFGEVEHIGKSVDHSYAKIPAIQLV